MLLGLAVRFGKEPLTELDRPARVCVQVRSSWRPHPVDDHCLIVGKERELLLVDGVESLLDRDTRPPWWDFWMTVVPVVWFIG